MSSAFSIQQQTRLLFHNKGLNPRFAARRLCLCYRLKTTTTTTNASSSSPTNTSSRRFSKAAIGATVAIGIPLLGISIYTRQWRKQELKKLPKATTQLGEKGCLPMDVDELILDLTRMALMGTSVEGAHSVQEELDAIRKWHLEHNFKGGLVLRDLKQPLFGEEDVEEMLEDPTRLARRECYYLYYERLPSAEIRQEIFCRGTTLKVDVLTCLQFWYVYDEELEAWLHLGFRNHAERLVNDVLPLLVVNDKRATIHLHGHSLGGAVAAIVALKLKKRGYNVTRLTTAAAPRFCSRTSATKLAPMLPSKSIRIENDRDIIPFLPPFGVHLKCDKLWLLQNDVPRYIRKEDLPTWVDSVWANLRVWEILSSFKSCHFMASHVKEIKTIKQSLSS